MKQHTISALLAFVCIAAPARAQEPAELAKPHKEHELLQLFVGEWESESEASAGPDQPAMKCRGTMSSRMLGGFWVVSEYKADLGGTTMNALQTIGYDEKSKKYVSTWVDSMVNHLWKSTGSLDETGKVLTLEAEGPNFLAEGKISKFRDAYEFKSKDHIALTSSMLDDKGKWVPFMTSDIRRKK